MSNAEIGDEGGVTNQLIARLQSPIGGGVLTTGSKLPPGREPAPAFGVGRSSLGHNLKGMEIIGVQRLGDETCRAMANSIGLTSHVVDWEHTLGFHRPIYSAIEKRHPVDARLAMIAHLSDARSILERFDEKARKIDVANLASPLKSFPGKRRYGRKNR